MHKTATDKRVFNLIVNMKQELINTGFHKRVIKNYFKL